MANRGDLGMALGVAVYIGVGLLALIGIVVFALWFLGVS